MRGACAACGQLAVCSSPDSKRARSRHCQSRSGPLVAPFDRTGCQSGWPCTNSTKQWGGGRVSWQRGIPLHSNHRRLCMLTWTVAGGRISIQSHRLLPAMGPARAAQNNGVERRVSWRRGMLSHSNHRPLCMLTWTVAGGHMAEVRAQRRVLHNQTATSQKLPTDGLHAGPAARSSARLLGRQCQFIKGMAACVATPNTMSQPCNGYLCGPDQPARQTSRLDKWLLMACRHPQISGPGSTVLCRLCPQPPTAPSTPIPAHPVIYAPDHPQQPSRYPTGITAPREGRG